MSAPQEIIDLVERFAHNLDYYHRPDYNETQARREFIDPFFMALGWDVDNRKGVAPRYQEVIHEATVREKEATRAPDYCFRVGPERKFFVEAKKPAVDIAYDIHPAFQLRRYAWTAKLPLSILTDFEEFSVYDCQVPPKATDKAATARVLYVKFTEYAERWDEIAAIFSREAVWRGDYDRYAQATRGKRGTQEVDDAFLQEIERWRELLARNIALRNPQLGVRELNYAVQQTIDRLIFLRICEDRDIEPYEQLRNALQGGVYARLMELFRRADERYNSGLFHFRPERGRERPDTLTPALRVDDKVLAEIIDSLYYPNCPYAFEVLSADILGNVYERFLGSVIRLTPAHRAVVEQKPEVRKAGGVYYTPKYIVDYIVQHTVGALCEGKTPSQIANLRILDPACGSGSFLLGAYEYLLNYHLNWYVEHPTKQARKEIYQGRGGEWFLTTEEKKRILLNNIYGVDIDPQAVEVTKLSLLLKVLEGESQETIAQQRRLWEERTLPDLSSNIKCGNSLIGYDFLEQMPLLEEERYRINAFDWQAEFPQVFARPGGGQGRRGEGPAGMGRRGEEAGASSPLEGEMAFPASSPQQGGFDAVIGNPPYVRQEMLGELKEYFQRHYQVYHGVADLYVYFIERGISLLKPGGLFSYIVANKWLRANYGRPLRRWLKTQEIEEIVDFGDLPVFEAATTYPCILRVRKSAVGAGFKPAPTFGVAQVESLDFGDLNEYVRQRRYPVNRATLDDGGWALVDERTEKLLAKLRAAGVPLGEYVQGRIYRGVLTGLNEAFIIDAATRERLIAEDPQSAELIVPFLMGRDIKRYAPPASERWLIFTRRGVDLKRYPAIERHLVQFRDRLMPKPKGWEGEWHGRKPGPYKWYEIQDAIDYYAEFEKPKIIYPNISKRPEFTLDDNGLYTNQKCFIISLRDLYLLGLLNSAVTGFMYRQILPKLRGGFYEPSYIYFKDFPIRPINFSDPADRALHDEMVALVERMLALHKRLAAAQTPHEKALLQRQIEAADRQIDRLVYELYGLTEEEIKLVEKGSP